MLIFHDTISVSIVKGDFYEKKYTKEQRDDIVQRYWSGEPVASISADTGVAKSTIYKWAKETTNKKTKSINMSDYRILKQRCETLEKMVEILQMSPYTVSAPLHDRYEVIKDLSDTYSVSLLCKTLMVAKGSYFNHLKAKEDTVYALKKKEITPIIDLFARKVITYTISKSNGNEFFISYLR